MDDVHEVDKKIYTVKLIAYYKAMRDQKTEAITNEQYAKPEYRPHEHSALKDKIR